MFFLCYYTLFVYKLLISLDPYISSFRTEWKHSPIPIDVKAQNLLYIINKIIKINNINS